MAETWLTSDLHLGHNVVARLRGFDDHLEHDARIARNWDKRVRQEDQVWVLGDVAMNGWANRLSWFTGRPGTKHLVLGNHDRAHPLQRNAHTHLRAYLEVFDTVQIAARLQHKGTSLLLSHFPYAGEGVTRDEHEDRHTQWRLRDEGGALLHGHVHDAIRLRYSPAGSPMVHVGLDAWSLAPVTLAQAAALAQ